MARVVAATAEAVQVGEVSAAAQAVAMAEAKAAERATAVAVVASRVVVMAAASMGVAVDTLEL